jgi:membrane protein implicated in regulation of membrane protease activity
MPWNRRNAAPLKSRDTSTPSVSGRGRSTLCRVVVPVVGVVVAVFILPPGWGTVLLVAVISWEVIEKLFWIRLIGRYPVVVGREAMIGMSVVATTTCRPEGRVRLQGENWQARCSMGARPGETLVVEGVDRITLIVGKRPHVGAR